MTVNNLEQEENPIRVVFAVNMLNEGWDVLNLFDIVRLYDTRDSKYGLGGKTTIAEAQLIGRGARYFPFTLLPDQDRFTRKYDEDLKNDLRILEQLYYHSPTDSRYIAELRKELVKTGIKAADDEVRQVAVKLKDGFKMTVFYKNAVVFQNKRIQNTRKDIKNLNSFKLPSLYSFNLVRNTSTKNIFVDEFAESSVETKTVRMKVGELPRNVVNKALDKIEFYSFATLSNYLPNLLSREQFIDSNSYCGEIEIEFTVKAHNGFTLHSKEVLGCLSEAFESIKTHIIQGISEFKGSAEFEHVPLSSVLKDEVFMEVTRPKNDQERGIGMGEPQTSIPMALKDKDWYVYNENYGTDQEKHFLVFFDKKISELRKKFDDVYVIRNEKFVKLFAFENGEGVEPDFLLYAASRGKKAKDVLYYQLFVEPKGSHLMATDNWKQEFLTRIKNQHKVDNIFENAEYKVYGLPFYNTEDSARKEFEEALKAVLGV